MNIFTVSLFGHREIDDYGKYYDSVIIPESVEGVFPKSALVLKNRWMIERSDLVIVYVKRENGGAYTAMKYAERMQKRVINLCKLPLESYDM